VAWEACPWYGFLAKIHLMAICRQVHIARKTEWSRASAMGTVAGDRKGLKTISFFDTNN
jgi:hypothetical protein